jgi:hypothetical protein
MKSFITFLLMDEKTYHSSLHNLSLFRRCMQEKKEEGEVRHGDENS